MTKSIGRDPRARRGKDRFEVSERRSIELRTPGKLNLGLRVIGVRDDGYHLLESIFAPIDVWDHIEIEVLPGGPQIELQVTIDEESGLPPALSGVSSGPDNLVFRAAEAFCAASGLTARIRIQLHKGIPAAAGLGGGSSDAAAVLAGLAELTAGAIDPADLERAALRLGADVPFFLDPRPSHVAGIGEIVTPVDGLAESDLVVVNPGISLDTAEVYRATDALGSALTEPRAGSTMRAFSHLIVENRDPRDGPNGTFVSEFESGAELKSGAAVERGARPGPATAARLRKLWAELLINDLEPAARRLCPPVGRWISAMQEVGAVGAGMTGSGATVFGVFESKEAAQVAAGELRRSSSGDPDAAWIQESRLIARS